jgi:hypothetical protein
LYFQRKDHWALNNKTIKILSALRKQQQTRWPCNNKTRETSLKILTWNKTCQFKTTLQQTPDCVVCVIRLVTHGRVDKARKLSLLICQYQLTNEVNAGSFTLQQAQSFLFLRDRLALSEIPTKSRDETGFRMGF